MKASLVIIAVASVVLAACRQPLPIARSAARRTQRRRPRKRPYGNTQQQKFQAITGLSSTPTGAILQEQKSVFDFDVFTIKSEFTPMLERRVLFRKAHPELQVKLEGNADKRGGRRSTSLSDESVPRSVKRALVTLGAADTQFEAISFGRESEGAGS
jgi:peptidoglycan-associated lipoprotein